MNYIYRDVVFFSRDILIFHANKQQVYDVTKLNIKCAPLMLCLMDEDHYDAVYKKHHIETAGFCQCEYCWLFFL